MTNNFQTWNEIPEPKDFPEINEEKFKITDKATIKELKKIMYSTEKSNPTIVKGSNQFTEKAQNVFGVLDTIKAEQSASASNRWLYYNLEDVEIDDATMRQGAFDFLDQLGKRNAPQQTSVTEMELEFRPTFQRNPDKIKKEKDLKGKQSVEKGMLSFGDEL